MSVPLAIHFSDDADYDTLFSVLKHWGVLINTKDGKQKIGTVNAADEQVLELRYQDDRYPVTFGVLWDEIERIEVL